MLKTKRLTVTDLIIQYSDLIGNLSCPIDRINDYSWVYDNIKELNPYNTNVNKIIPVLKKLKSTGG